MGCTVGVDGGELCAFEALMLGRGTKLVLDVFHFSHRSWQHPQPHLPFPPPSIFPSISDASAPEIYFFIAPHKQTLSLSLLPKAGWIKIQSLA